MDNSSDARVRHQQKAYWSYFPKTQFLDWPKFKCLLQEPWNSLEHKVRNGIILTFTSSITQLEKPAFYLHKLYNYSRVRHRQKAYWPSIPKILFSDRRRFKFLLQEPWNSIEDKVRKGIILTFTSFSIRQLEKPAFYLHGQLKWCTSKTSTERLLIVDSKNTIFRHAQIQVSATGALKFNRT
jgi:hypothetical protein